MRSFSEIMGTAERMSIDLLYTPKIWEFCFLGFVFSVFWVVSLSFW